MVCMGILRTLVTTLQHCFHIIFDMCQFPDGEISGLVWSPLTIILWSFPIGVLFTIIAVIFANQDIIISTEPTSKEDDSEEDS